MENLDETVRESGDLHPGGNLPDEKSGVHVCSDVSHQYCDEFGALNSEIDQISPKIPVVVFLQSVGLMVEWSTGP